jgi:hypothetical protein
MDDGPPDDGELGPDGRLDGDGGPDEGSPRRGGWLVLVALALVLVVVMVVVLQSDLVTTRRQGSPAGDSQASVVLDPAALADLGLRYGPDSAVTRLVDAAGHVSLYFTANPTSTVSGGFRLYRFLADPDLTHIALAPSHPVLEPGAAGDVSPVPWCTAQSCFDQTYAGGGTLLQCPGGGPLLVAYHGEEATDPSGDRNGTQGWSGIGIARWDGRTSRFVKVDQAIGLAASNIWRPSKAGPVTDQTAPASFQGDLVYDPSTDQVRVYYGDVMPPPSPGAAPLQRIGVASVDRARLCAATAAGRHANWRKWYDGAFSQPGVYTTDRPAGPAGTGGLFTPMLADPGATSPSVVRTSHGWYMITTVGHATVELATSTDGLHWSQPTTVYRRYGGEIRYASLFASGSNQAQVTFTWNEQLSGWNGDFALEQFPLSLP